MKVILCCLTGIGNTVLKTLVRKKIKILKIYTREEKNNFPYFKCENIVNVASNLIFAYAVLVGFLLGIGLKISKNHQKFIKNPIVQIIGGYAFVQKSLNNHAITSSVIFLFYISTLLISRQESTYKELLGETLGNMMIDLAQELNLLD